MAPPKLCLTVIALCSRGHDTSHSSTESVVSFIDCLLTNPTPSSHLPLFPKGKTGLSLYQGYYTGSESFSLIALFPLKPHYRMGIFLILKFLPAGETWDKEQFYFLTQEVWALCISSKFFLQTEKLSSAFLSSHTLSYSVLRSQMTLSIFFLEIYQFSKFIYLYFKLPQAAFLSTIPQLFTTVHSFPSLH